METETKPDAPVEAERPLMYAEIAGVGDDCTLIAIHMFDKVVKTPVTGRCHEDRARAEVDDINATLEREWYAVRQTTAEIMRSFVVALHENGVTEEVVNSALSRLRSNVGA